MEEDRQDIITDFFAHSLRYVANGVRYGSEKGIRVHVSIPDFGKVVSIYTSEDFGIIKVRRRGAINISTLQEPQVSSLVSFMEEMNHIRRTVQEICQLALSENTTFTVFFDGDTAKTTRLLFANNCLSCEYTKQYDIIRSKLMSLGYAVKQDPNDTSVAYIAKYKAAYLARSTFGKFIYTITHID